MKEECLYMLAGEQNISYIYTTFFVFFSCKTSKGKRTYNLSLCATYTLRPNQPLFVVSHEKSPKLPNNSIKYLQFAISDDIKYLRFAISDDIKYLRFAIPKHSTKYLRFAIPKHST